MPMPAHRPRLRKREIVFAVAMGGLAAGGAGLILSEGDSFGPAPIVATADNLNYEVGQFAEISTVGPQDVIVTIGDEHAVRSEGSPEALALLEVVVEDGKLVIQPKDQFRFGFDWERLSGSIFFVTVPRLERVALAGSGNVAIDRIESESFAGTIAGSGELEIAQMTVDEADFTIGGSGSVTAVGTAKEARVSIGGSGEVHAGGLRSETASVSIGGSGDVEMTVADEAEVSIMGSGNVDIAGGARCSVSRMGSGEVRCDSGAD